MPFSRALKAISGPLAENSPCPGNPILVVTLPWPTSASPQALRAEAAEAFLSFEYGQVGSPLASITPWELMSRVIFESRGGFSPSTVLIFAPIWTLTGASSFRGSFCGAILPWKEIRMLPS